MKKTSIYYSHARPEIAVFIPDTVKTILDIGCGAGEFLKLVKDRTGAETWGIEVEDKIAKKAKQQVDKVLTGNVEEKINSIPDRFFDCITFNDVLEHFQEPSEILKKIKSKLSQNGIIVASIPNVRYYNNIKELIIKREWEYRDAGILDSTHLRFFTQKSMKRMFEEVGYRVEKQVGINKATSMKYHLFNLLTLGLLNDARYMQFVCIVTAKG